MAALTLYCKDAVPTGATLHRSLQDGGSITAATTTTGWVADSNASAQSCLMVGGTEVARNAATWGTTLQPSAAPSTTLGDCWRTENTYNGTFANSNWVFTFGFRSVTAAYTGRLKLAIRIWRTTSQTGASAVELTSGRVVSAATGANLSTSADTTLTCTWTPGATVTLADEYLFVNTGIEITSAGGGTTQDFDFRVSSAGGYALVTPNFVLNTTFAPGIGADVVSGQTPVALRGSIFQPDIVQGVVSGQVPVALQDSIFQPGIAQVIVSGLAPTATVDAGAATDQPHVWMPLWGPLLAQ